MSTVKLTFVATLVFPAASLDVILAVYVHSPNAGLTIILQFPLPSTNPVYTTPLIVIVIILPTSPVPVILGVVSLV